MGEGVGKGDVQGADIEAPQPSTCPYEVSPADLNGWNEVSPSCFHGHCSGSPHTNHIEAKHNTAHPPALHETAQAKDTAGLKSVGGIPGLAKKLYSDLHAGLDPAGEGLASIQSHQDAYGKNEFKETPPKSFFSLVWENLQDPVIIILCCAAAVSVLWAGRGGRGCQWLGRCTHMGPTRMPLSGD